jgi:hypothetical protein
MANRTTNIQRRRRLKELYAREKKVYFGQDGAIVVDSRGKVTAVYDRIEGEVDVTEAHAPGVDDIVMVVVPPNPLQREQALREGNAARSDMLLKLRKDSSSQESIVSRAWVSEMDLETLIDYVLMYKEDDRKQAANRIVLAQPEWKDITALQDRIRQWDEAGNPDTEEWQGIIDRDTEFGLQIATEINRIRESDRMGLGMIPRAELEERAVERRNEWMASQEFVKVYEREMLLCSIRDPDDTNELFFESVTDLMSESEFVADVCAEVLKSFITDSTEAKNSSGAALSSESSVSPAAPETTEPSTPETDSTSS